MTGKVTDTRKGAESSPTFLVKKCSALDVCQTRGGEDRRGRFSTPEGAQSNRIHWELWAYVAAIGFGLNEMLL